MASVKFEPTTAAADKNRAVMMSASSFNKMSFYRTSEDGFGCDQGQPAGNVDPSHEKRLHTISIIRESTSVGQTIEFFQLSALMA
jgi:hypothetical protein